MDYIVPICEKIHRRSDQGAKESSSYRWQDLNNEFGGRLSIPNTSIKVCTFVGLENPGSRLKYSLYSTSSSKDFGLQEERKMMKIHWRLIQPCPENSNLIPQPLDLGK
jgi:hypothetical protein